MATISHPPFRGVANSTAGLPTIFISASPIFWRYLAVRGSEHLADVSGHFKRTLPQTLAERFALIRAQLWMLDHNCVNAQVIFEVPSMKGGE
jgi:hypothetical protein